MTAQQLWAETPLTEVVEAFEDDVAAGALREVALRLRLGTMRDLLAAGDEAARMLPSPNVALRLKAALDRWVSEASAAAQKKPVRKRAASKADTKAPPPDTAEGLMRWAKRQGLADKLAEPAQNARAYLGEELAWAVAYLAPSLTIADLVRGKGLARGVTTESAPARALRKAAQRFLVAAARAQSERDALEAQSPAVKAMHQALDALADTIRQAVVCANEAAVSGAIELDAARACARVSFPSARASDAAFGQVFEFGLATQRPRLSIGTSEGANALPPQYAVAFDQTMPPLELKGALSPGLGQRAIDAVSTAQQALSAENPTSAALRTLLDEPAWQRLFRLAEDILGSDADEDADRERVVWCLASDEGDVSLAAATVRLRRDGVWGKPTLRARDWLGTHLTELRPEVRALALQWLAIEAQEPGRARRLSEAELMRDLSLAGLLVSREGHPLYFEERTLTLRLDQDETERFRFVAHSGDGLALSWEEIVRAQGAMLLARPGLVVWLETPARVLSLIKSGFFEDLSIPREALDPMLERMLPLQEGLRFNLPDYVAGVEAPAQRAPRLVLEREAGGRLDVSMRVQPLDKGPYYVPGQGPAVVYGWSAGGRCFAGRDFEAEEQAAHELFETLALERIAKEVGSFHFKVRSPEAAAELLRLLSEMETPPAIDWRGSLAPLKRAGNLQRATLRLTTLAADGALAMQSFTDGEGQVHDMQALLEVVRRGGSIYTSEGGDLLSIGDDLRDWLKELDARLQPEAEANATVSRAALVGWSDAFDGFAIDEDAAARALREALSSVHDFQVALPEGLETLLRPYQKDGLRWMLGRVSAGIGACLADDMGLGKTLQSISLLKMRSEDGAALVVCPTSVATTWEAELKRFAPELKLLSYRGQRRQTVLDELKPGTVVLASYDVMTRDVERLKAVRFSQLIFDEAHYLKNSASKRREAAAQLNGDARVALTGTPLENHLGELWSLMDLLNPGLLGSYEFFRDRFVAPTESKEVRARLEMLRRRLAGVILRRTKREVAPELPPRTETVRWVELNENERGRYRELQREALDFVAQRAEAPTGGGKQRFEMLAWLTKLRQLVCHPRLLDAEFVGQSSKLAAALEVIEDAIAAGQRILVFSQFTSLLKLLREALDARFQRYLYLDGTTPTPQRTAAVEAWQREESELFLLSLKAGGTGLNLTGSDYVLLLDPWWNPAVEDQASDRAHRIGQQKPVSVVRFVCEQTVEESVLELHSRKRATARSVLEGDEALGTLTESELEAMLRHGL